MTAAPEHDPREQPSTRAASVAGERGTTPPTGEADVHAEVVEEVAGQEAPEAQASVDGAPPPSAGPPGSQAFPGESQHLSDEVAQDRAAEAQAAAASDDAAQPAPPGSPTGSGDTGGTVTETVAGDLAAERLADLQRLQAEYVNYRRRVERDRSVARDSGVASVVEALLGVLDDIELSRQHGDLEGGPFAAIAEKLETSLGRFGLARYGAAGEAFDPSVHEALMHGHSDDVEVSTVTQVLQPGYKMGAKVLRAARVAVSDPH